MELKKTQLSSLLDDLAAAYQTKGRDVTSSLHPPLTAAEIGSHLESPSQTLLELYGWRNGADENAPAPLQLAGKTFLSLDRALAERTPMLAALKEDSPLLPIAAGEGAWYALDPAKDDSPVYIVGEVADTHFESLEAMLKTCAAWVAEPDWTPTQRPSRAQEIWYQHNPSIDE